LAAGRKGSRGAGALAAAGAGAAGRPNMELTLDDDDVVETVKHFN